MFLEQIGSHILEVSHKRIECPDQSVYFNHIHNHCELLLFISGSADYNIDGQIFTPSPYDLLFIPAGIYHYLIPTSDAPYENYVIGVHPSMLPAEHYQQLFTPPLMINTQEDAELKGFFERLDLYRAQYSDGDFARCADALIRELLTYCFYRKSSLHHVHSRGDVTHVNEIIRFIGEHIREPLDADTVAKHFHLSKSYVQNMFSQNMHIGLKKYIMQKKISAAHADISQGMRPMDACEKYAFGDYSSFFRLYKKSFSASPAAGSARPADSNRRL